MKIISVCGARPNFMKIAPLTRAFAAADGIEHVLVHTGQHYDETMSRVFFDELGLPRPDFNLEVGSASHAAQTAAIMQRFEPLVLAQQPDAVLVVGDVNSTIACGLVAVKLHIPLIHVEAGLRSFDRRMPEEINRILTDAISDLLFVTERAGVENLRREGVAPDRVHLVGNVMIDTLRAHQALARRSTVLADLSVSPGRYGVVTLHRPANVDERDACAGVCEALGAIQRALPLVFPVHPRTRAALERHGLWARLADLPGVKTTIPLGYLDFLHLMANAAVVLTDSGGIQEETTVLGVPCLTLRENTERPITIECGTNHLVGTDPAAIRAGFERSRTRWARRVPASPEGPSDAIDAAPSDAPGAAPQIPLWDGRAAERIARVIVEWHAERVANRE